MSKENIHLPVMLDNILNYLPKNENLICFDGTFGGGGYTKKILELGHIVHACDLDTDAVINGQKNFEIEIQNQKLFLENKNYCHYINEFEDNYFDYIVADLGFSSNQLEYSQRGFSYTKLDEEFDLRYFVHEKNQPAWKKIVYLKDSEELAKIIYNYSGEKLAFRLAERIFNLISLGFKSVKNSEQESFKVTVGEVVEVIDAGIPKMYYSKKKSILSRIWQAIRIWVNKEFENIERFLISACLKLKVGGKLAVVSFHSLEDKLITKFMRQTAMPIDIDEYGNKLYSYKLLTKKPETPAENEVALNPRSRSAFMRVLEKTS